MDDVSLEFRDPEPEGPAFTKAREEIGRLYAKMDDIHKTGDFDSLRAIAAPQAKFGSSMMSMSLDDAIRETKKALTSSKVSGKTEIASIELVGDEAKIRTRSIMTMTTASAATTRAITSADSWIWIDGAWRLRESLMVSAREVLPPTDPETTRAVVSELKKRAIPLSTVEAGKQHADLDAFGKAVGDARVVSLGEATHGTREVFQMKHRLLEYLVKEKGFTVFAIEANWPESEAADRYIKTGIGDPKEALAAMYFWTWQTEEVLAMLEWMREFNRAPGEHPILSFTSFDMQAYQVPRDRVLAYIKRYAPDDVPAVELAYASLLKLNDRVPTGPGFDEAANKVEGVVTLMESHREALSKASSPAGYRDALQMARIVTQAVRMRTSGADASYRDQMMAKNTEWLLKEAYPKEKIVLWAHNGHISISQSEGFRPMGHWLRESLGNQMFVLGFAIHSGTVRASTTEGGKTIGLAESKIPRADPGTGTGTLSGAGHPLFFLDLRNITGTLGGWLASPHLFQTCGALWDRDNPESFMNSDTLSKSFDGLIYIENSAAARGIKR